jgi:parvulin-like peptidyl-prolyl isomerase
MQHFSLVDSGRSKGGDEFDFAAKLHLGDKLFAVAATLTSGEISDPVVESDGVHIVIMEERRPPRPADFTASRSKVYADYRNDLQLRAREENLKFLRSNAQILLAPGHSE